MLDVGRVHFDLPPEPRPCHLTSPIIDGPVAETEASARESVQEVVDFIAAFFKWEPVDSGAGPSQQ